MEVLRTPDERFESLVGYPYSPRYVDVRADGLEPLRMNYVDAGPTDADPVLLVHGQPTWSYLYRKVIAGLVGRGLRAVAPDNIGYGRSDKPADKTEYTFQRHIDWTLDFVRQLDLRRITLFGQDWGGPIGLAVLAAEPDRFARVVVGNTILHTSEASLAGRLDWANHGIENDRVVIEEALLDYIMMTQRAPDLGGWIAGLGKDEAESTAYQAPFPDERYRAGVRQMTALIPVTRNDPGSIIDMATWAALAKWEKPLLTAFSDGDTATHGWEAIFQERVPGAAGQPHVTIKGAGHFVQEDKGEELAEVIADFIEATPI